MASSSHIRTRILAECDRDPWGDAVPRDAIAAVRQLVRSVYAALESLSTSVEAARGMLAERLHSCTASVQSDTELDPVDVEERLARINAAHAKILAELDRAEALKRVALEQEAVAADAALDATEAELEALRVIVAGSDDATLEAEAPVLVARARAALARLSALPHAAVESPEVYLDITTSDGLADDDPASCLGSVRAERGVSGVQLRIPRCREAISRVKPGVIVAVHLELDDEEEGASQARGPRDAARLLTAALAHVRFIVELESPPPLAAAVPSSRTRLPVKITLVEPTARADGPFGRASPEAAVGDCASLRASFRVPSDAPPGSSVRALDLSVAGRPVSGQERLFYGPGAVDVVHTRGATAPLVVRKALCAARPTVPRPICIDADATLYVPGGQIPAAEAAPLRAFQLRSGAAEVTPRCATPALNSLRDDGRQNCLAAVAEDDSRDMIVYATTQGGTFAMAYDDSRKPAWHAISGGNVAGVATLPVRTRYGAAALLARIVAIHTCAPVSLIPGGCIFDGRLGRQRLSEPRGGAPALARIPPLLAQRPGRLVHHCGCRLRSRVRIVGDRRATL